MYCKQCGIEIHEETIFCPRCGTKQSDTSHKAAPVTTQPIVVNVHNVNTNTNTNNAGMNYPQKSRWAAFFICLFLGEFGIHRFYVGKVGTGMLWLFTLGLCGIGWIIDLFCILFGAFRDKAGYPLR